MTKQHLYSTPFWSWKGWDILKWLFAALILAAILTVIWMSAANSLPEINANSLPF